MKTIEEAGIEQAAAREELARLSIQGRSVFTEMARARYSNCWHLMTPEGKDSCVLLAYMENKDSYYEDPSLWAKLRQAVGQIGRRA